MKTSITYDCIPSFSNILVASIFDIDEKQVVKSFGIGKGIEPEMEVMWSSYAAPWYISFSSNAYFNCPIILDVYQLKAAKGISHVHFLQYVMWPLDMLTHIMWLTSGAVKFVLNKLHLQIQITNFMCNFALFYSSLT